MERIDPNTRQRAGTPREGSSSPPPLCSPLLLLLLLPLLLTQLSSPSSLTATGFAGLRVLSRARGRVKGIFFIRIKKIPLDEFAAREIVRRVPELRDLEI